MMARWSPQGTFPMKCWRSCGPESSWCGKGLVKSVPVFIVYGTALTYENGDVHFSEDIYGHDASLAAALARGPIRKAGPMFLDLPSTDYFAPGVFGPELNGSTIRMTAGVLAVMVS